MIAWFRRKASKPEPAPSPSRIPTTKFDASRVTDFIKAEIRKCVAEIDGPTVSQRDIIYDAAIRSVSAGRDLHTLYATLMGLAIEGMTKRKASTIATHINNKTTSLMDKARRQSLGITQAQWMYSGAPCMTNPKKPTTADIDRNTAHKAANGQRFDISEGLLISGKRMWPGEEEGCRCVSRSVIPGFS